MVHIPDVIRLPDENLEHLKATSWTSWAWEWWGGEEKTSFPRRKLLKWLFWLIIFPLLLRLLWQLLKFLLWNSWPIKDKIDDFIDQVEETIEQPFTKPTYSILIDEPIKQELSGNNQVRIFPITSGYYEAITDDETLIDKGIITKDYPLPKPIPSTNCTKNDQYWNLSSAKGLNYNSFVYEYLINNTNNTWKDIVIAILDSWINTKNKSLTSHLFVNTNEQENNKDSDNDWYVDNINGINVISKNGKIIDKDGHGTHVAWIILQTFPNAKILPIKITEDGTIYDFNTLKWLRYVIDHNVDVINMSFGWEWEDPLVAKLIEEAVNKGIIVVAAAGNEGQDVKLYYPASSQGVVSVGSFGQKGKSLFSNYGADLDMPWECIYSYSLTGENMIFMDGTSMSSPHLAGIIWAYRWIKNKIGTENEVINLVHNHTNKQGFLDVTKLFGIENENNKVYEALYQLKTNLENLQKVFQNLKTEPTEQDIKTILSYQNGLKKGLDLFDSMYQKENIKSWFWTEMKQHFVEYINLLGSLDPNAVYLNLTNGKLNSSLWVSKCITIDDCGRYDVIIPKGSSFPTQWEWDYVTMENDQTEIRFKIYEGENEKVINNNWVWSVLISWLPKRKSWEAWAKIKFSIDQYWKLTATAIDNDNSKNQKTVTISASKLDIWSSQNSIDAQKKLKNMLESLRGQTNDLLKEINQYYQLDPTIYLSTLDTNTDSINIPSTDEIHPESQETSQPIIPIVNKIDTNKTCNIKGNISYTNGEKIYHMSWCSHYADTVINTEYGERWFCSEQEARDAWWRKCKE